MPSRTPFTRLACSSPSDLFFGKASKPLRYGLGLEVGTGFVVPEIKYFPRRDRLGSKDALKEEYLEITRAAIPRR